MTQATEEHLQAASKFTEDLVRNFRAAAQNVPLPYEASPSDKTRIALKALLGGLYYDGPILAAMTIQAIKGFTRAVGHTDRANAEMAEVSQDPDERAKFLLERVQAYALAVSGPKFLMAFLSLPDPEEGHPMAASAYSTNYLNVEGAEDLSINMSVSLCRSMAEELAKLTGILAKAGVDPFADREASMYVDTTNYEN